MSPATHVGQQLGDLVIAKVSPTLEQCMFGPCRSEKKVLNEVNHSKELEQLRYHVMASKDGNKIKERVSLPAEKLFLLVSRLGARSARQACLWCLSATCCSMGRNGVYIQPGGQRLGAWWQLKRRSVGLPSGW